MPEVFIKAILVSGGQKITENLLLNTGARGAELVIRRSLAKSLGMKTRKKTKVYPLGPELRGDVGSVEVTIRNPETGEKRTSLLEAIVLSNKTLDCSLLGVVGQEKLGVIPDTFIGKPIFK